MALQLQFFIVQAVNYSATIVKIKCKIHNITDRKRLPWCDLINSYNLFFTVNMFRHMSRQNVSARLWSSETRESRKIQGIGQRLGSCNVSSRTKFWTSRSRRRSRV